MNTKIKDLIKNNKGYLLFLFIFFALRWSFADQTRVPTGSMIPTIAIGDHIFINKLAYDFKIPFTQLKVHKFNDPKPGDIVVFRPPHDPKTVFVKRLIAVPGDHVEIKDGFLKINGVNLSQNIPEKIFTPEFNYKETLNGHEYTVHRDFSHLRPEELDFIVPQDKYFFVGDNRDNSADSRMWGFVDRSQVIAKAERVFFSLDLRNYIPKLNIFRTGKKLT